MYPSPPSNATTSLRRRYHVEYTKTDINSISTLSMSTVTARRLSPQTIYELICGILIVPLDGSHSAIWNPNRWRIWQIQWPKRYYIRHIAIIWRIPPRRVPFVCAICGKTARFGTTTRSLQIALTLHRSVRPSDHEITPVPIHSTIWGETHFRTPLHRRRCSNINSLLCIAISSPI